MLTMGPYSAAESVFLVSMTLSPERLYKQVGKTGEVVHKPCILTRRWCVRWKRKSHE